MNAVLSSKCVAVCALFVCAQWLAGGGTLLAQKPPKKAEAQAAVSRELAELYRDDQKDQNDPTWTADNDLEFSKRQETRRDRVMQFVTAGQLASAEDWNHAAMLLQHGQSADDYLLAHVLAVPPATQKLPFSEFMSAATLDRFLQHIGRPQIFATQTAGSDPATAPLMEPFDDSMSNSIRAAYGLAARARPESAEPKHGAKAPSAKDLPKLLAAARGDAKSKAAPDAAGETPEWLVRTRAIVDAGALKKDVDYFSAAQILLHSTNAEDLLDAHVLSVAAALLGHEHALPQCAETLDRFLIAAGRTAILGTLPKSAEEPSDASTRSALHRVILERYELLPIKGGQQR